MRNISAYRSAFPAALVLVTGLSLAGVIGASGLAQWIAESLQGFGALPLILMIGLVFAVALMGIAANIIAQYIERYRWIAWIGLLVILYVAGSMIYTGITDQEVGLTTLF